RDRPSSGCSEPVSSGWHGECTMKFLRRERAHVALSSPPQERNHGASSPRPSSLAVHSVESPNRPVQEGDERLRRIVTRKTQKRRIQVGRFPTGPERWTPPP